MQDTKLQDALVHLLKEKDETPNYLYKIRYYTPGIRNRQYTIPLTAFFLALLLFVYYKYTAHVDHSVNDSKMVKRLTVINDSTNDNWLHPMKSLEQPSNEDNRIEIMIKVLELAQQPVHKDFIPPLVNYKRSYMTSKKYKLAACEIEKNLSTLLSGLFCYLWSPKEFMEKNLNITSGRPTMSHCWRRHEHEIFNSTGYLHNDFLATGYDDAYLKFTVIRHPITRFISAFLNKCIDETKYDKRLCYGCDGNFKCVAEMVYMRLQQIARGDLQLDVRYEDRHFVPQSWLCGFNKVFGELELIKHESSSKGELKTINSILKLLEDNGLPAEIIDKVRHDSLETKTYHATSAWKLHNYYERLVRKNPYLHDLLKRIYYFDFLLFRYDTSEFD